MYSLNGLIRVQRKQQLTVSPDDPCFVWSQTWSDLSCHFRLNFHDFHQKSWIYRSSPFLVIHRRSLFPSSVLPLKCLRRFRSLFQNNFQQRLHQLSLSKYRLSRIRLEAAIWRDHKDLYNLIVWSWKLTDRPPCQMSSEQTNRFYHEASDWKLSLLIIQNAWYYLSCCGMNQCSSTVWAAWRRAFSFEMIPTSAATASIIRPHPVEAEEYRELHEDWF